MKSMSKNMAREGGVSVCRGLELLAKYSFILDVLFPS